MSTFFLLSWSDFTNLESEDCWFEGHANLKVVIVPTIIIAQRSFVQNILNNSRTFDAVNTKLPYSNNLVGVIYSAPAGFLISVDSVPIAGDGGPPSSQMHPWYIFILHRSVHFGLDNIGQKIASACTVIILNEQAYEDFAIIYYTLSITLSRIRKRQSGFDSGISIATKFGESKLQALTFVSFRWIGVAEGCTSTLELNVFTENQWII